MARPPANHPPLRPPGLENPLPFALVGGVVALAAALLIRSLTGTRLLAEVVVDASTYGLQPRGFSFLLGLLGAIAKTLLFLTVLAGELALYVGVWSTLARGLRREGVVLRVAAAAAVSAGLLVAITAALVLLTVAGLGSDTSWPQYAFVTAVCSLAFAATAGLLTALSYPDAAPLEHETEPSRRRFLARVPGLALGGLALLFIGRTVLNSTGGGAHTSHAGHETPEVTANEDFYIVSKNLLDPGVDAGRWRLRVGGASKTMLEISYRDVLALPSHEQYTTLQCISNEVNGDLISNALWTGFPLSDLLDRVEPLPSAAYVVFRCDDDYTESVPMEFARHEGVMLAHTMNGQPLPTKHGFPLRLLSPGKYGLKHPKWITEIALMDRETFGYWQQRGWDQEARLNTSSRIDVPAPGVTVSDFPFRIHGIAFAGDRGISRVEVSTDGGSSWNEAVLKPALSPYTWVLWYFDWQERGPPGPTTILARAYDGSGAVQTAEEAPPYPAGATGYPRVSFNVSAPL